MDLFVKLLFGHVFGDFFLQPKCLAVNKYASTVKSIIHAAIYTLCIQCFTTFDTWQWPLFILVTHFAVDRFSLADHWLKLVRSRPLKEFILEGHKGLPPDLNQFQRQNYRMIRAAFHAIVYTITDNSMHLISMYYAYHFIFHAAS